MGQSPGRGSAMIFFAQFPQRVARLIRVQQNAPAAHAVVTPMHEENRTNFTVNYPCPPMRRIMPAQPSGPKE
jgi:hypothetical protein